MPRVRNLTARLERRERRSRSNTVANNDEHNDILDFGRSQNLDLIDILNDNFKDASNVVPRNFDSFDCGPMELICRFCQAKHFNSEVTQRDMNAFTVCCHKGKVSLLPLTENDFFNDLFNGLSSNDSNVKRRSKNFFENIRSFNSAFAMVSSEAKIDNAVMQGVYHFKIHDVFYHRAGALTSEYGRPPCYAQLYFYDVDTAVNHRLPLKQCMIFVDSQM